MIKFSANLSLLFTELDLEERFLAAAEAGFTAVEIQFPYSVTPERLATLLDENGLELVLFNLPAGDWEAGERGIACHPDRIQEFRGGVDLALRYAKATGCTRINCLAGIPLDDTPATQALSVLKQNLSYAAPKLAAAGIDLCVEPINTRDIPGFLLNKSKQTVDLLHELNHPNLRLQYDIYHMQIMEGDLTDRLSKLLPWIGHIQIADVPGRHQPGTGEINFPYLFNHLDSLGYTGWIGLEYRPLAASNDSFDWLEALPTRLRKGP